MILKSHQCSRCYQFQTRQYKSKIFKREILILCSVFNVCQELNMKIFSGSKPECHSNVFQSTNEHKPSVTHTGILASLYLTSPLLQIVADGKRVDNVVTQYQLFSNLSLLFPFLYNMICVFPACTDTIGCIKRSHYQHICPNLSEIEAPNCSVVF